MRLENTVGHNIQMTQTGTGLNAWCNEDDDAHQHVHMTARKKGMSQIWFSSCNLNSYMHMDQCRHAVK